MQILKDILTTFLLHVCTGQKLNNYLNSALLTFHYLLIYVKKGGNI